MLAHLKALIRFRTEKEDRLRNKDILIRRLVSAYSRGNANLQRGRYVTQKQRQERLKKILHYKFH